MRLVDALLRQGHLSDRALAEAILTGDRPAHLDRCDLCAERAVEMNRWLDTVHTTALEVADEAFPAERLAAQQAQILRRLEQLDEPARVIAFPRQARLEPRETGRRRVAPAWVGVAAAAGLVIGVIGGQLTARVGAPTAAVATNPAPAPELADPAAVHAFIELDDVDAFMPEPLDALNALTPRVMTVAAAR